MWRASSMLHRAEALKTAPGAANAHQGWPPTTSDRGMRSPLPPLGDKAPELASCPARAKPNASYRMSCSPGGEAPRILEQSTHGRRP